MLATGDPGLWQPGPLFVLFWFVMFGVVVFPTGVLARVARLPGEWTGAGLAFVPSSLVSADFRRVWLCVRVVEQVCACTGGQYFGVLCA